MKTTTGTLHIVSTPIGNPDDISLRAAKILKQCDLVVCEEGKMGARLLHQLRVSKPLEELNEHNEQEQTTRLLSRLEEGASIALISDAGTPLFADPGLELVQRAVQQGITIVPVPGASSIMTALVASCLPMQQFFFAGFLSREPNERLAQLRVHANEPHTVVLLETPYRLLPLLEAAASIMPTRKAFLGCNLTMPSETLHHGTVAELLAKFQENRFKGEFVFAFAGNDAGERAPVRDRRAAVGHSRDRWGGRGFDRKEGSKFGRKGGSAFGRKEGERFGRREGDRFSRKEGSKFGRREEGSKFGRREEGSKFDRKEGSRFGQRDSGKPERRDGGEWKRREQGGFGKHQRGTTGERSSSDATARHERRGSSERGATYKAGKKLGKGPLRGGFGPRKK